MEYRKENQALRTTQIVVVVSVAETISRGKYQLLKVENGPSFENHKEVFSSKSNDIKEGSLVKVGDIKEIFIFVIFAHKKHLEK